MTVSDNKGGLKNPPFYFLLITIFHKYNSMICNKQKVFKEKDDL